ncbi:MAG TPA: flagellar motor switch protein FliM [Thermodesulfobacteriota bacterium]|nr:flagellar motor switch protein FliM [Thermodesulfobacteriota bacterium]
MEKILSQEEIDALLNGMSDGQVDTNPEKVDESNFTSYDLTSQDRIIRGKMPTLEIINSNFCRLFRTSLSLSLNKMIDVTCGDAQMVKCGEFVRTLPVPSSLQVFRMEPLRGYALLVLDYKLVFSFVDIFLGGQGKTSFKIEGREFTAIESRLIRKVVQLIFNDLEKAWNMVHPVSVRHIRSEINPQFVGLGQPSDLVIMVPLVMELDQSLGQIHICIPYSMVEPIKEKLFSGYQSDHLEVDHSWAERLLGRIRSAEVDVVVELGRRNITVQDLFKLSVGEVLMLENEVSDFITARVEGVPKFLGRAGVTGANKAFQVEQRINIV